MAIAGGLDYVTNGVDEDIIPCIWPKTVKVVGSKGDGGGKAGKKRAAAAGKGKGKT